MLALRGLRKRYGELIALDRLDLEVHAGACVALIGHNGSGKTTTLRLAAGLLEPTEGSVTVAGADVHHPDDARTARAALSFVPDSPLLYGDLTVREHLELTGLAHGVADLDERVQILLDVLELAERAEFLPGQLSRGMRQKTQLACALLRPFQALVLDEPVVGLDPPSQQVLAELLTEVKRAGGAILLSTHQLAFTAALADRAVILHEGSVVAAGDYRSVVEGDEAARLGLR